jgi:hypothetical protein
LLFPSLSRFIIHTIMTQHFVEPNLFWNSSVIMSRSLSYQEHYWVFPTIDRTRRKIDGNVII